jgi:hypothetical protein
MKTLLIQLDIIENEYKEHFSNKSSYKLKHYIIKRPYSPSLIYIDLDEIALKNCPLPKEIEEELRITFKASEISAFVSLCVEK